MKSRMRFEDEGVAADIIDDDERSWSPVMIKTLFKYC